MFGLSAFALFQWQDKDYWNLLLSGVAGYWPHFFIFQVSTKVFIIAQEDNMSYLEESTSQ